MLMFVGVACVLIVVATAVTAAMVASILREHQPVDDDRTGPRHSPVHRLHERILLRWDTTRRLRRDGSYRCTLPGNETGRQTCAGGLFNGGRGKD